ncbi:energy transducer TonB [Polynucleobacter yangtzensis]|uniref:energy transducer TonB n=1 Tax=Polynucleobacter yangtzensis TaxID=1743159 RepID=UPI0024907EFA|nr:energy transducer TonB [Polynucleobacter yangtzensis]
MASKSLDSQKPSQAYIVVLMVALVHLFGFIIYVYGVPKWSTKRVSDITIELGGSFMSGDGGQGSSRSVKASDPATPTTKSSSEDGTLKRQNEASKSTQSSSTSGTASESSSAAGIQAAPTVDADYKAAYLNNPKPPYPAMAFKMRVEGTVILKALIQPDGKCSEVVIAKTSGNDSLDRSALNTVSQWQFTPAKAQGKEISQWVNIPITFSIKNR